MRILWWLFLPSLYLLFMALMMRFLEWASELEDFDGESTREDTQ